MLRRRLSLGKVWEVIAETGLVSVAILLLLIAASTFCRMLTLSVLALVMGTFLGSTGLGF